VGAQFREREVFVACKVEKGPRAGRRLIIGFFVHANTEGRSEKGTLGTRSGRA